MASIILPYKSLIILKISRRLSLYLIKNVTSVKLRLKNYSYWYWLGHKLIALTLISSHFIRKENAPNLRSKKQIEKVYLFFNLRFTYKCRRFYDIFHFSKNFWKFTHANSLINVPIFYSSFIFLSKKVYFHSNKNFR